MTLNNWTIFKPNIFSITFWWVLTLCFGLSTGIINHIVEAPLFAKIVFVGLDLYMIAFGIVIMRARFRYNDVCIESRYFRSIKREWKDVEGWSQLGESGSLFIRFTDGVVLASDDWLLTDHHVKSLIPVLKSKVGEARTGNDLILPWFLRHFFGPFIKSILSRR